MLFPSSACYITVFVLVQSLKLFLSYSVCGLSYLIIIKPNIGNWINHLLWYFQRQLSVSGFHRYWSPQNSCHRGLGFSLVFFFLVFLRNFIAEVETGTNVFVFLGNSSQKLISNFFLKTNWNCSESPFCVLCCLLKRLLMTWKRRHHQSVNQKMDTMTLSISNPASVLAGQDKYIQSGFHLLNTGKRLFHL